MEFFTMIAIFLLVLQTLTAIVLFGHIEDTFSELIWNKNHKFIKPWTALDRTPRELMKQHSICVLDIANLRGFRAEEYGQLVRSSSVLYHVADRFDKKTDKTTQEVLHSNEQTKSESEFSTYMSSDNARKKLRISMERHANKLQRRRELEIYNCRKTNFKRFATERMIGLGHHRNVVDPSTLIVNNEKECRLQ